MAKRKSKGGSSGPATSGWEGVYSGFILIMLCFFIMLCSFSKVAPNKMNKFVRSFVASVDMFKGGFGFQTSEQASDARSEDVGLEGICFARRPPTGHRDQRRYNDLEVVALQRMIDLDADRTTDARNRAPARCRLGLLWIPAVRRGSSGS